MQRNLITHLGLRSLLPISSAKPKTNKDSHTVML
jgi:hypothetical protein